MDAIDHDLAAVSRRMLVQYSGIVQDFNPVHYDDEFARKAGLPGIIAQGPLTVTLVLDSLIGRHGVHSIAGFKARLKAPVRPGDRLHIVAGADGSVVASVEGKDVLSGTVQTRT